MSSETACGISPQPKPMCPKIDKVIEGLEQAMNWLNHWQRDDDVASLRQRCSMAEHHIDGLDAKINDIRAEIEKLRQWGQEWKDHAKSLE